MVNRSSPWERGAACAPPRSGCTLGVPFFAPLIVAMNSGRPVWIDVTLLSGVIPNNAAGVVGSASSWPS